MLFRLLIVPLAFLPFCHGYGKLVQLGDGLLQEIFNRYGSSVKDDSFDGDFDVSHTGKTVCLYSKKRLFAHLIMKIANH